MTSPIVLPQGVGTAAKRGTTNINVPKLRRTGLGGRTTQYHPSPPVVGKTEDTPSTGVNGTKNARQSTMNSKDERISQRLPEPEQHLNADSAALMNIIGDTAQR